MLGVDLDRNPLVEDGSEDEDEEEEDEEFFVDDGRLPMGPGPRRRRSDRKRASAKEEERKGFSVIKEAVLDSKGRPVVPPEDHTYIVLHYNSPLLDSLKGVLRRDVLYDARPKVDARELLACMPRLRRIQCTDAPEALAELLTFLEEEFKEEMGKLAKMDEEGVISFSCLWARFQPGTRVTTQEEGEDIAFDVEETRYRKSQGGLVFQITGTVIKSDGEEFFGAKCSAFIRDFEGVEKVTNLAVQHIDPATEARLVERGRLFAQYGLGIHFLSYRGELIAKCRWGTGFTKRKADGRVVVDGANFQRFNPDYADLIMEKRLRRYRSFDVDEASGPAPSDYRSFASVADDRLFACWPFLPGFAFGCKEWGQVFVRGLSPIEFDAKAFERLVLDGEKKQLIRSLVEQTQASLPAATYLPRSRSRQRDASGHAPGPSEPAKGEAPPAEELAVFSDIITGKGGGCIFLLHGEPGTGKTLTVEAIAELLQRPLYYVTVGELGETAQGLETALSEILEVALAWKAVVLLDEADIFLEARALNDVHRNALVSIFLRMLEYFKGILFLTTNRVVTFDPAFKSRISVALRYDPLDHPTKEKIWRNLLEAARVLPSATITSEQIATLALAHLNGRQIKNSVRLACSLARAASRPVSLADLQRTAKVASGLEQVISDAALGLDASHQKVQGLYN